MSHLGPQSPRPRLLLVDDEPDMLDFLERVLRRRYEVTRFSDPVEALAKLASESFDVIITDQRMPALSGLELIARAERLAPSSVRLMISGFTDVPEIELALAKSHIHNFLLKPVDSRALLEAIDTAALRAAANNAHLAAEPLPSPAP